MQGLPSLGVLISVVGFEVYMGFLKMSLLGEYEPYRLVICYLRFGRASCHRLQGKEDYPFLTAACTPYSKGAQIPGD